jgi:hypothetical protein
MLHVATVHFQSPRWIAIQARELQRHLTGPYRTWASLEQIDGAYGEYFDQVDDRPGSHAEKLNWLAAAIVSEADDEDLIMFLDGDAFPVADPRLLIESSLDAAPLMAVRRAENCDDPQPHPCFCVTRVATWRSLPGDWSEGFTWTGPEGGQVTDVGANLLQRLQRDGTPWTQILRSNRHDLHPVFFGVYGDVVYHHGAGFRLPLSRADVAELGPNPTPASPGAREMLARNTRLSEAMFNRIAGDDPGWLAELA